MSPAAYLKAQSVAPAHFCSKTAFPSRAEARRQIGKVKGRGKMEVTAASQAGPLIVYKCSECALFHLTHKTRTVRGRRV